MQTTHVRSKNKRISPPEKRKSKATQAQIFRPLNQVVSAPTSVGSIKTLGAPKYQSLSGGNIRVTHREYLQDVYSSGISFNIWGTQVGTTLAINPGLRNVFPWLSSIAPCYESYTFERLSFEYEPFCSTATAGEILMAIDFDVLDAVPNNKQTMSSNRTFVRSNAWLGSKMVCARQDLTKAFTDRYVRIGPVPGSDQKTYDVGQLIIATNGVPVSTVGSVYVEYSIVFKTPAQPSLANDTQFFNTANVSTAAPFGTTLANAYAGNQQDLSKVVFGATGDLLGFPNNMVYLPNGISFNQIGKYLLDIAFQTDSAGTTFAAQALGLTITDLDFYGSFTTYDKSGANPYIYIGRYFINVLQNGAQLLFTPTTGNVTKVGAIAQLLAPYILQSPGPIFF
jgi:hypothetical protein